MNSAGATAVVESVGEARPREFVMCSGMSGSESELAEHSDEESSDETGPLWSIASGMSSNSNSRGVCW